MNVLLNEAPLVLVTRTVSSCQDALTAFWTLSIALNMVLIL